MSHPELRVARAAPSFVALSCIGFIATATPAHAQSTPPPTEEAEDATAPSPRLGGVTVTDTAIEEAIKVERVASPKATSDLIDTPQTITVISDQTLRKQNLLTLRDALSTVPGITFTAGEGGGGYGDRINLRGFSADNDITQDGVRDSAQYSRTDPFNLQQIEVYNGANSVFNGSGSVGGTINLVSKVPQASDLTIVSGAIGTDDYYRGTLDTNQRIGDLVAVRLNAMVHKNDVPGRDVEKYERWAVAPSVTIGIDSPTSLTFAYLHQEDDNTPVYGVPYYKNQINDGPLPEADRSDYFGFRNIDRQDITVDQLTMTFAHRFSDRVSLRNLTRWQRVEQDSVTSAPQGTFCLSTGTQPISATPTGPGAACPVDVPPGFYLPSGPRGLIRDQENQLLYNQTDLRLTAGGDGIEAVFNLGASFTREDYQIAQGNLNRNPDGSAFTAFPVDSIADPTSIYSGPLNRTITAHNKSTTSNVAAYLFNTTKLGDHFEINGGIRYENNKAKFRAVPLVAYPPGTPALTPEQLVSQRSDEDLFSYRIGAVYKPIETVSLYAAYANSRTPSSATVRLGCGTGATAVCDVAPEKALSYEIGAKADLFDRRLQLTAALFRNERTNFRVPSNQPGVPDPQVLDGRSRVDGIALGASGNITDDWTIFANYTYLDSKIRQSVSDFCLGDPGSAGCNNSVAIPDPQRGDELVQTPKHSGSLFTAYTLPFGLEIGYGLTYQGSFATNNSVLLNQQQYRADDWLTHRAFLSYPFGNGLTAQLNVQNVTNEKYFTSVRNNVNATSGVVTGGWAAPGEKRSAVLSLYYSF